MDYKKKIFDIFMNSTSELEKYNKIIEVIEKAIFLSIKDTDIKHYDNYVKIINSINNAGHEERRSKDISFLNKLLGDIDEKYDN